MKDKVIIIDLDTKTNTYVGYSPAPLRGGWLKLTTLRSAIIRSDATLVTRMKQVGRGGIL